MRENVCNVKKERVRLIEKKRNGRVYKVCHSFFCEFSILLYFVLDGDT